MLLPCRLGSVSRTRIAAAAALLPRAPWCAGDRAPARPGSPAAPGGDRFGAQGGGTTAQGLHQGQRGAHMAAAAAAALAGGGGAGGGVTIEAVEVENPAELNFIIGGSPCPPPPG